MRKPWMRALTGLAVLLLLAGVALRVTSLPDQILFAVPGMLLLLCFVLPAVLYGPIRTAENPLHRLAHVGALLLSFGLALAVVGTLWSGRDTPNYVFLVGGGLIVAYLFGVLQASRSADATSCDVRCVVLCLIGTVLVLSNLPLPVQTADPFFKPDLPYATYSSRSGPVVFIDEAHNNFHTAGGRFKPFAQLLERDGYRVEPVRSSFTLDHLRRGQILVIANALSPGNINNWAATAEPALLDDEVRAVRDWVVAGGSLFLIADHHPFGGAVAPMATAFGFELTDGFVDVLRGDAVFSRKDGTLISNSITDGRRPEERVDGVRSFLGEAIQVPGDALPILVLDSKFRLWSTRENFRSRSETESAPAAGLCQLAYRRFGKGRVVVAGEAAMFSAQLEMGLTWLPLGMNAPGAEQNDQLLLNIVHWLDGRLD
jgi:hypothetical protein